MAELLILIVAALQPAGQNFEPDPAAQAVAVERAQYMSHHGYRWHPPGLHQVWRLGVRFEGAGWG